MEQLSLFAERLPARPYCTDELTFGLRIRPKSAAAQCRYVQPNNPNQTSWLVFDVDHGDAALRWSDVNLPAPSLIVVNRENGHAHLLYAIETPVFGSPEHQKPMRLLAAIYHAYLVKLDADCGYSGLISKNPLHSHWHVIARSDAVYSLGDLAEWVDLAKYKKLPKEAAESGLGRNCTMFDRLRKWAYQELRLYREVGDSKVWDRYVYAQATKMNDFPSPLPISEVRAIAKSTARWCWKHFDLAASDARFSKLQAHRGRKGGRPKTTTADGKPWEADGVSRATWYRRVRQKP